jgi:hypothetical protein
MRNAPGNRGVFVDSPRRDPLQQGNIALESHYISFLS